jgi:hypothetical protein
MAGLDEIRRSEVNSVHPFTAGRISRLSVWRLITVRIFAMVTVNHRIESNRIESQFVWSVDGTTTDGAKARAKQSSTA